MPCSVVVPAVTGPEAGPVSVYDLPGLIHRRDSEYANHFKIPRVTKALESGHGVRFELEWSPTPGKKPEMQVVTFAPPTYIGCASAGIRGAFGPGQ